MPTNMAAGTSTNNPLVDLTGARFAGLANLPNASIFGADGGMGAPPSDDDMATLLEDPNMQQSLNEALNNPAMIDMMINSSPLLRDNPFAREMLQSPNFRAMLTNPQAMRQAAQMRRQMGGMDGLGEGGNGGFPAPGATDTTPAGSAATPGNTTQNPQQPLNPFGGDLAGNPFGALFNMGAPPAGAASTGAATAGAPNPAANAGTASNPFGALFGGAGSPFGPNGPSPEVLQQAMQMLGGGAAGAGGPFGNMGALGGAGGAGLFGGAANTPTPAAPADTRPPEERYAEQLRQLNDMGFFDFDRNIEALRRSGGSVTGAVENLLR